MIVPVNLAGWIVEAVVKPVGVSALMVACVRGNTMAAKQLIRPPSCEEFPLQGDLHTNRIVDWSQKLDISVTSVMSSTSVI